MTKHSLFLKLCASDIRLFIFSAFLIQMHISIFSKEAQIVETVPCSGEGGASDVYLQNHSAVCVAGEEAGVPRLGGLEVGGDAYVSVAQRNLHVSVVVLHQGSAQREPEETSGTRSEKLFHPFYLFCALCIRCKRYVSGVWEVEWWDTSR